MTEIKYPIGKFSMELVPDLSDKGKLISNLHLLPTKLLETVRDLTEEQLDTPYRTGGWTLRQVIHHIPDSHMNGYIRFKWALTENKPHIKPYDQTSWAVTSENNTTPPLISVSLLENIHQRWVYLLKSMSDSDFDKTYINPESGEFTLLQALTLYDWHGRHHLAQIKALKSKMNW